MARQTAIPCVLMRGGTSKGPYFRMADLPSDPGLRDRVLLAVMGSPHPTQIDGLGGAQAVTSKVAMVGPSARADADVDYLFAQIAVDKPIVDTAPSCGNILAGVGPFAVDSNMVSVHGPQTTVRIYNINTDSLIEAVVQTPDGAVAYDGDAAIDGVNGSSAPVMLRFIDVEGSKTGKLLPTGRVTEVIDGIKVTLMDVAVPMMILRAADMGKTGYETKAELDADTDFLARMETMRLEAGRRMGLGDVSDLVVPKTAILAAPRDGGSIASRYFVPHTCHPSHAVTGAQCVSACALMPGTVADGLARLGPEPTQTVVIEHVMGKLEVAASVSERSRNMRFHYGGVIRTARRLFQGEVLVPAAIWPGRHHRSS